MFWCKVQPDPEKDAIGNKSKSRSSVHLLARTHLGTSEVEGISFCTEVNRHLNLTPSLLPNQKPLTGSSSGSLRCRLIALSTIMLSSVYTKVPGINSRSLICNKSRMWTTCEEKSSKHLQLHGWTFEACSSIYHTTPHMKCWDENILLQIILHILSNLNETFQYQQLR